MSGHEPSACRCHLQSRRCPDGSRRRHRCMLTCGCLSRVDHQPKLSFRRCCSRRWESRQTISIGPPAFTNGYHTRARGPVRLDIGASAVPARQSCSSDVAAWRLTPCGYCRHAQRERSCQHNRRDQNRRKWHFSSVIAVGPFLQWRWLYRGRVASCTAPNNYSPRTVSCANREPGHTAARGAVTLAVCKHVIAPDALQLSVGVACARIRSARGMMVPLARPGRHPSIAARCEPARRGVTDRVQQGSQMNRAWAMFAMSSTVAATWAMPSL